MLALRSTAPELCYSGRRFGGKSNILCLKGYLVASMYPGARVAICREERAAMEGTTLLTLRTEIVPRGVWASCWKEGKSALYLPNGSEVHVFGLDRPGRALGARYAFVGIDQAEQLSYEQFQIINSCAMQTGMPWHQVFCAFNPEGPDHWAYQRYSPDAGDGERVDQNGKHFADVVHVNPNDLLEFLSEGARERFDRMDGVYRARLRLGQWAAFDGLVFDNFDPAIHAGQPRPEGWAKWGGYPPPDWQRFSGLDFGFEDPYVWLRAALSPDGVWWVYRQDYRTRLTIDEQTERILAADAEELATLKACAHEQGAPGMDDYLQSLNVVATYSDHERGHREMYQAAGIPSVAADKDIRAGLETVRGVLDSRFAPTRIRFCEGNLMERDSRLAELHRPTCVEEEFPRYRWRTVRDTRQDQRGKDLPVDRDNHGNDALRYMLHTHATSGGVGLWM